MTNPKETILTDAATNTFYHEDNNNIWQPMNNNNNNRILYENRNSILLNKNYHFQPIDHDFSSSSIPSQTNLIQRPIPISNYHSNTIIEHPTKRNSIVNINSLDINSTIRSYALPRSMTSDQLTNNNNTTNRLYYYPSVQDVLDALNRRSFDKESYV